MGKVLKADAAFSESYAAVDLASGQTDVWVTCRCAFDPASLAAGNIIAWIVAVFPATGPVGATDLLDAVSGTGGVGDPWETPNGAGGFLPAGGTWTKVEFHYVKGDPTEVYVNDVLIITTTNYLVDDAEWVSVGEWFGGSPIGAPSIVYFDDVKVGTTRGAADIFADDFESGDLSAWTHAVGDVSVVNDPFRTIAPPTQVFGGTRFYEAPTWRQIVTDTDCRMLTELDKLALDRSVTVTRAASRIQTVRVPSDNPEVNIPAPDPDSPPFVSEGTRFLYSFRREAPGSGAPPWVVRAAGIVLDVTDEADSDHATSIITAYDPWKYLYRRPVLLADGSLPGDAGRVYPAGTTADEIIIEQLSIAEATGGTVFTDYASTGFYAGTIETTDPLPDDGDGIAITFARGVTLGEMLDTLVATGTCDVVFDPIYDPVNRPGILCELSIYRKAGQFRPNAIFGWDKWPRNVVQLSRQIDGTGRANRIQMFAGQGGPPVPEQSDAASIAEFGEYWALQYLPGVPSIGAAKTIAERQLALIASGAYTYALSPAAERAPLLFEEYREADTVTLHADRRFRDPITGLPIRVESIPIVIGDDQLERVNQMLVSFSPETGS